MWDMKADNFGDLTFEIQDAEGYIVELVSIEGLEPNEVLYIEMFAGEIRGIK